MTRPFFVMPLNNYNRIIERAKATANTPLDKHASLFETGGLFEQWFNPGIVQEREFGQQVALEQLQYEQSINYKRQMDEMKKAGINPNLAASGISQSGSVESTPSVPSTPSGISPSDIGNLASGITGGAASIGDAVQKLSSFREFKENLRTQSIANLEKAGLDHWSAVSIAETLPNIKDNQRADFYMKLANIKKVAQEYENLKANHENIIAEYDAIIARKDLDISQQQYFDALKGKVKENTEWQEMQNDFFKAHNYSADSNLDVSLRNSVVSGRYDEASVIGDVVLSYNDNAKEGEQKAVARNAYDIAYESGRANYEFDWSAPPKTMFEFFTKAAVSLKDKLHSFREKFSGADKVADDVQGSSVDESTLKNSYIEYKGQLSMQYERLNMMRSELADKIADGANRVETTELRQEIAKFEDELKFMPHSYKEFKKYVRNQ